MRKDPELRAALARPEITRHAARALTSITHVTLETAPVFVLEEMVILLRPAISVIQAETH